MVEVIAGVWGAAVGVVVGWLIIFPTRWIVREPAFLTAVAIVVLGGCWLWL